MITFPIDRPKEIESIKQIMLIDQHFACAICFEDIEKSAYMDHDHQSNYIRGLLCRKCNWGLGNFRDNTELLERAVEYLKSFDARLKDFKQYIDSPVSNLPKRHSG